jgi:hypothetical protein
MWPWSRVTSRGSENDAGAPAGAAERIATAVLSSELGTIAWVSRAGMAVHVEGMPKLAAGAEIEVELAAPTECMTVRGRVTGVERVRGGPGRYEITLEFVGLSEEDARAVESLARFGKKRPPGMFTNNEKREKLIEALKLPDYYGVLGVAMRATAEEIHGAYRAMARKYHPDVCKDSGAQQRFCMLNEAHATLTDEARRAEYDALYSLRKAA